MLHCFLLREALVIEIDENKTSEGLEPGARGALAKILCQNPTEMTVPQSESWFFVLCPVSSMLDHVVIDANGLID
jgi:hypothetical protein